MHLPAWQWGRSKAGNWQILDSNNASDADLWIAYSLLAGGKGWTVPLLTQAGKVVKPYTAYQGVSPALAAVARNEAKTEDVLRAVAPELAATARAAQRTAEEQGKARTLEDEIGKLDLQRSPDFQARYDRPIALM